MSVIDVRVVFHNLPILTAMKFMTQIKRKVGKDKREAIDEEVDKLENESFITEIKYLTWILKRVMVWKVSNKWHMCVEFIDLNATYSKYMYLLPNIYQLIHESLACKNLSSMDTYSKYNHIKLAVVSAKDNFYVQPWKLLSQYHVV